MNIIWVNKPAVYDTRNVTRVWFERTTALYTVGAETRPERARVGEIQMVLDDAAYALTGRNRENG